MAPRGIEEQTTRELFEVFRQREMVIIIFVNELDRIFVNTLDREGRDPFDLLDGIEQSLVST
jgi:peptide chain release factor 3